ncbi:MAG: hypothetical protein F6J97_25435 [Leptolyngbya sp. SIO4C1]|nr:hypothetical protein [Leptolyngbya sp. SIO4C1]
MKFSIFDSSVMIRSLKGLLIAFICGVLLFANSLPAFAFGNSSSRPEEGTAQLNQVQEESEAAIKQRPRGLDEIKAKANSGLNAVQGSADASKMKNPATSRSEKSVADQAEDALKSAVD